MTEFWQQAIPVFIMFGVVLALGPFIGFAMWLAFGGDAMRERDAAARVAAAADAAPAPAPEPAGLAA